MVVGWLVVSCLLDWWGPGLPPIISNALDRKQNEMTFGCGSSQIQFLNPWPIIHPSHSIPIIFRFVYFFGRGVCGVCDRYHAPMGTKTSPYIQERQKHRVRGFGANLWKYKQNVQILYLHGFPNCRTNAQI